MNLFVIYLGGSHERALIEVHDIYITVAEKIEDTYQEIRDYWWGKSVHLDAWGVLKYVDERLIQLKVEPSQNKEKLYFVNMDGYDSSLFTELHENLFIVAESEEEAKKKAKAKVAHFEVPHKDNLYEIENILLLKKIKNFHIHLEKSSSPLKFEFICKYTPL